jgi:hypothetical protein
VRKDLKFGDNREYKPEIDVEKNWNFMHQPPGAPIPLPQAVKVMVDLAGAMKYNPGLKVMVKRGLFRSGNAVLRRSLRNAAFANSRQLAKRISNSSFMSRGTWYMRTRPH